MGWKEYADAAVDAVGDRTGVILVAQSLALSEPGLVVERLEAYRTARSMR